MKEANQTTLDVPGHGQLTGTGRAVISLVKERGTSYKAYLSVYEELNRVYEDLWNEKSKTLFGKAYTELSLEELKVIKSLIPFVISEGEPTQFGKE